VVILGSALPRGLTPAMLGEVFAAAVGGTLLLLGVAFIRNLRFR
jgi:hypothetical protein